MPFRPWSDGLVAVGLRVLVAAGAVYVAVRLILAVWLPIAVIGGVLVVLGAVVALLRARARRW